MDRLLDFLAPNAAVIGLSFACLILGIALYSWVHVRKGDNEARTVILVGPESSGKTALFAQVGSPCEAYCRAEAQ